MVDSPSRDAKLPTWNQSLSSSDKEDRMLESAFSAFSISGNRPPALSASSISSIGEDLNHKGADFSNYYATSGAPSSPLSNASVRSHFHYNSGSALNSPSANNNRHEGCITPVYQPENGKAYISHASKYSSLDSALYVGGGHKSLPTFQEHINEFDDASAQLDMNSGVRSSERSQSFHEFNNYSKPRRSTPDSLETNGSVFGNWPPTNARSTHSLSNMGSVDENEQYFGNRARAASATATLGYNRGGNFTNVPSSHEEFRLEQNHHTAFSHHGDISLTPQYPLQNREASFHNRQRVMSADDVHHKAPARSFFESSQNRSAPHNFSPLSPNPFAEQQHQNRPRSFSANTPIYPSASSYSNVHQNLTSIDSYGGTNFPQSTTHGRVVDGSIMLQSAQTNDLQNNILHNGKTSSRAYMFEHQHRPHEIAYGNQERFIRHGHKQPQKYIQYGQNLEFRQPAPRTVYTVKFKRSQKNFFLSDNIRCDIKIGLHVKVEADRGEDLGIVLSRIPIEKFNPGARLNAPNMDVPDLQLKRITALATESDIALLQLKEEEEAELLKICRNKTLQRGLPMNVVDAEYQFDRHKLTFFFEASCRVDFRELVRDLFSIYKTRIWMQQIDKVPASPLVIVPGAESNHLYAYGQEALQTSNNYNQLRTRVE